MCVFVYMYFIKIKLEVKLFKNNCSSIKLIVSAAAAVANKMVFNKSSWAGAQKDSILNGQRPGLSPRVPVLLTSVTDSRCKNSNFPSLVSLSAAGY